MIALSITMINLETLCSEKMQASTIYRQSDYWCLRHQLYHMGDPTVTAQYIKNGRVTVDRELR